jgi:TatD-related deoxyribonuclease
MLREVMTMAAGAGTSIQLHAEDNGETTCRELATLCDEAGLARNRAIRHYAPADIGANFTHGLAATVSVGRGSVETITATAASANAPWGMETDFLDDPRRPGAVLGPKTVPKRTQQLCAALQTAGWDEDEVNRLMSNIHSNWPAQLYSTQ